MGSRAAFLPLGELYNLAVLLPAAGIGARRLQDTGRNGKLVWALFMLAAISQILAVITAFTVFRRAGASWPSCTAVLGAILIGWPC